MIDEITEIFAQGLEAEPGRCGGTGRGGLLGARGQDDHRQQRPAARLARTMMRKVPASSSPLPLCRNQTMAKPMTRPQEGAGRIGGAVKTESVAALGRRRGIGHQGVARGGAHPFADAVAPAGRGHHAPGMGEIKQAACSSAEIP